MDELNNKVREIVERSANPVTAEEAVARADRRGGNSRWMLVAALVALVALVGGLVIAAASNTGDDAEDPIGFVDTAPTPTEYDLPEPGQCITPASGTEPFLDWLLIGGRLTVHRAQTVESSDLDYQNLFFISAEIDGPRYEGPGDIATWAANFSGLGTVMGVDPETPPELGPNLTIVTVNDLAGAVSRSIHGLNVPSMDTDGALESQECVAALAPAATTTPPPEMIVIPDLTGKNEIEAANALQNRGFEVAFFEEEDPNVEEGRVVRTDPAAGESLEAGGVVSVMISTVNIILVPNVVGLTSAEAANVLRGAELNVTVEPMAVPAGDANVGKVVSQVPAAGSELEKADVITIVVGQAAE